MTTEHSIFIGASQRMPQIGDCSVDLVITSPPYPMVEMWDAVMAAQNPDIAWLIEKAPMMAFELMHQELDKVWKECFRVVKPGGFVCINIGDATRTINGSFTLYDNHSRISKACVDLGFVGLPNIIWRKQTNAPNKFMGSGMLPCGAYVTLEHEYILIFRKGCKREYRTAEERLLRMESSYFWEERNMWFSDLWDVKGARQSLKCSSIRSRSAAYPLEIPFRLVNMYSQKGDTVLDPFVGTGTTAKAAVLSCRNSIGYDIDGGFASVVHDTVTSGGAEEYNRLVSERMARHLDFIREREESGKDARHFNRHLNCKVMTKQESEMKLAYLKSIQWQDASKCIAEYQDLCN